MTMTKIASDSFTRPANTTQYAAGDAITDHATTPTVQSITVGRNDVGINADHASGVINYAQLVDSANQATKADLECWLFRESPTAMEDNAAFDPTDAECATRVGVLDFGNEPDEGNATVGAGGNCVYEVANLGIPFECETDSFALYWVLVERGTYTPVSEETFTLILSVLLD